MNFDIERVWDINSISVRTFSRCNYSKMGDIDVDAVAYTNMSFWAIDMSKST